MRRVGEVGEEMGATAGRLVGWQKTRSDYFVLIFFFFSLSSMRSDTSTGLWVIPD